MFFVMNDLLVMDLAELVVPVGGRLVAGVHRRVSGISDAMRVSFSGLRT
jgi:hypothetical protein